MNLENGFNLVLSGGAALGYAHIGVVDYLHSINLEPTTYHGVSMGAIVASIEAIDISHQRKQELYSEVFSSLKWVRVKLNGALISTSKIEEILDNIFGKLHFSHLKKELHIIATNYHTGELTIFNRANDILIKDAILASMAVPALFPPREINKEIYVDGYLSSNLPLASIDNNLPNLVVNVTSKNSFEKLDVASLQDLSIFSNLERSIRILIYNQTKDALNSFKKDYILIEPPLFNYKTSHFYKFEEIKDIGFASAKESLGDLIPATFAI
jgi:NTE family protein